MSDAIDDDSWLYGKSDNEKKEENCATDLERKSNKNAISDDAECLDNQTDIDKNEKQKQGASIDDNNTTIELQNKTENGSKQSFDASKNSNEITNQSSDEQMDTNTSSQNVTIETNDEDKNGTADESEDSEDDVQVTIGAITPGPSPSDHGLNRNFYRNPVQVIGTPKAVVGKGIDLNAPGNINGQAVVDFDLDSLVEKPWRKPGSQLSSFFNYGFNEASWKIYCYKQKKLRFDENAPSTPKSAPSAGRTSSIISSILAKYEKPKIQMSSVTLPTSTSQPGAVLTNKQTIPAPPATPTATSSVTAISSPAVVLSTPTVAPAPVPTTTPLYTIPPGLPLQFDPTKPPPSLPLGIPPGFPGVRSLLPPTIRPPGTDFVPLPGVNPPSFLQQPSSGSYVPPTSGPVQPSQVSQENGDERRHSQSEPRSDDSREYRGSRRDYDRDRDRYQRRSDYRERSRDRDRYRDRERDRDRDRERDRDRDRKRRDDTPPRHKSSRRKYEDEDRYSSSKHKKAKKHHKHKVKEERISDDDQFLTADQIKKEPLDKD